MCRGARCPGAAGDAKATWPSKMTELQLHRRSLKPRWPHLGKTQNMQVHITGT